MTHTTLEALMVHDTDVTGHHVAHPVAHVHRIGAAAAAVVLAAFGVLGLLSHLGSLNTMGPPVLGLTTNGLLSLISVVVAAILLAAAAIGGPTASTATAVVGTSFVVSGLVNMALLDTSANLLAFTFPNVVFSLGMGTALIILGLYGRLSGGLPADNPYRQARARGLSSLSTATETSADAMYVGPDLDRWSRLEQRVSDGDGTPEENRIVHADLQARAEIAHDHAWAHAGQHEPDY